VRPGSTTGASAGRAFAPSGDSSRGYGLHRKDVARDDEDRHLDERCRSEDRKAQQDSAQPGPGPHDRTDAFDVIGAGIVLVGIFVILAGRRVFA